MHHEIERPGDKKIVYFLWYDYFYKSSIERFDIPGAAKLSLSVLSRMDMDSDKRLKGSKEREKEFERLKEEYSYRLVFRQVLYFNAENTGVPMTIARVRFLNPPMLEELNRTSGKRHYYLRIYTFKGFMDRVLPFRH